MKNGLVLLLWSRPRAHRSACSYSTAVAMGGAVQVIQMATPVQIEPAQSGGETMRY